MLLTEVEIYRTVLSCEVDVPAPMYSMLKLFTLALSARYLILHSFTIQILKTYIVYATEFCICDCSDDVYQIYEHRVLIKRYEYEPSISPQRPELQCGYPVPLADSVITTWIRGPYRQSVNK